MREPVRRLTTVASAVLLSLVTLSVFASQARGPEAVLRLFHEGVARGDRVMVQSTLYQGFGSRSSQALVAFVAQMLREERSFEIYRSRANTGGGWAVYEVHYVAGWTRPAIAIWVVRRDRGTWKIDSDRTIEQFMRMQGP